MTTSFLTEAVAPFEFRETGRARYDCTVMEQAALPNVALDEYAAVCLPDPMPLTPPDWEKLADYVSGGGGLVSTLRDYVRYAEAMRDGGRERT